MDNNGPFGIDPEEFDRQVREAGEGLRDAFGKMLNSSGQGAGFGMLFDQFIKPGQRTVRPRPQPETPVRPVTACGRSTSPTAKARPTSSRSTRPS